MNKTIMLDVDGVLADFILGYRGIEQKRGLPITLSDRWDDYTNDEVWKEINNTDTFWMTLSPTKELIDYPSLWVMLNEMNKSIYFVTSRTGIDVRRQTEYWLNSYGIRRPQVIISNRKGEIARGIKATHSLDDKAGNAVIIGYMEKGCKSYLLNTVYNQFDQSVIGRQVMRIDTVKKFIEKVSE